jgi:hypothetical protein
MPFLLVGAEALLLLMAAGPVCLARTVVTDGSFEKGRFVNTDGNYMALADGSTTIKGWTVSTASGSIVWAKSPTVDGVTAAQGKYCIDLTGFGRDAVNGAVSQVIHLKPGTSYGFSMDAGSFNDAPPVVTVNGQALALTPGTPFSVNGTSWTPLTGTIVGSTTTKTATLTIQNTTSGAQLVFIDNIAINTR